MPGTCKAQLGRLYYGQLWFRAEVSCGQLWRVMPLAHLGKGAWSGSFLLRAGTVLGHSCWYPVLYGEQAAFLLIDDLLTHTYSTLHL